MEVGAGEVVGALERDDGAVLHEAPHLRALVLVTRQRALEPRPEVRGALAIVLCSAPSVPQLVFTIMEKAPTRAFSWLKVPTSAFTFKTLLRHYA